MEYLTAAYGSIAADLIRECRAARIRVSLAADALYDPAREVALPDAVREVVRRMRKRLATATVSECGIRRDLAIREKI